MKNKILITLSVLSLLPMTSFAYLSNAIECTRHTLSTYTLDTPHWYVAGNLGVSHLYDVQTPHLAASVDENGPGWDASVGYQWNSILGGELGYTQYYNSRETAGIVLIARTSHFAVHLNATARYPLAYQLSVLGKLGIAYSYAQKIYQATNVAISSGAASPYLGLGLDYSITPRTDLIGQWAFVRGNNFTGSSVLYSLGVAFAIA